MMDEITLSCRPGSRAILAEEESRCKVLVEVRANRGLSALPRLNFCLLLDRSFSMQESHKLERARDAAAALVERLPGDSTFTLVDFGSDVHVTGPLQVGEHRERLLNTIRGLQARSATNLYNGLTAAVRAIARDAPPGVLNRILLLSDGVATDGVTSDQAILGVASHAASLGIGISTVGLGADYDEVLLGGISDAAGGNHYYVQHPADLASVFQKELGRLEAVRAVQVQLELRNLRGGAVTLLNTRQSRRARIRDSGLTLNLDDLERGGSQMVLAEVAVPASPPGPLPVLEALVRFHGVDGDPRAAAAREVRQTLELSAVEDPEAVRSGLDAEVLRRAQELTSFQRAAESVERGHTGEAEPADVLQSLLREAHTLERLGSSFAATITHTARTIVAEGGITESVSKKTVVDRIRAQQGNKEGSVDG